MTARRPDLEARLKKLPKVTWSFTDLDVDSIDLPSSSTLQYRLTDIDEPTVDRYAADMTRGDVFPAVAVRDVRGKLSLIGGNHRRAAAVKAGIPTLPAYVITCTAAQARQLAYEDNRTHGLPLKPSERATLSARLVLIDGMSQTEAAAVTGSTAQLVAMAVSAERAARRAAELGCPPLGDMAFQSKACLATIEDDGLFAETVRTVLSTGMGGTSIQTLCSRIKAAPTLDDAFDRVDAVAAARQGHSGGRGVVRNDLTRLADAAFALLDVDPKKAAAAVADTDTAVWRDRIKRAARHLMAIDQAIGART